ncbi:response regulator [Confluentibacter flavum]|uniref:Response regulator n=1 Tax=Confluentibacter flavum TaxID=1909700 RepID=A0A2N3HFA9_9FLAO|nr:response regulator [Confluentibacter flavum]PKQ43574.1 response regulator [Confluentibacter flavum]
MKKQRYMLVDDDDTNNMICKYTIKRFDRDAEVKMFTMPEDGLASIKGEYIIGHETLPTVLFLDINMPSMTGWGFLEVFMQFDECVKNQFTIYILSSSIEDFTEKAKIYPFIQGFLSKPLKVTNLERVRKQMVES